MAQALRLAERGLYSTSPNPRVGCVLVKEGRIVGEGWHEKAGGPHAEVQALRAAMAAGEDVRGATAYVTLEPCSHHGRTPPCADGLVAAGIARVVAAMEDPNPLVAGRGLARLRGAGIETACGLLEETARELNIGFVSRMTRGRPWLRLKAAASLDGKTALSNGLSQWITGPEARQDGHRWRARACAILTGIGTVRDDNPRMSVRDVDTPRQPLRVVVDSRLEMPPSARLLDQVEEGGAVLIVGAVDIGGRSEALRARGAEVVLLPESRPGLQPDFQPRSQEIRPDAAVKTKVDLPALLVELGRRGVNELHVEAGCRLNGSLLKAGLVDELLLYLAPCLIGHEARGLFGLPEALDLEKKHRLAIRDLRQVGPDIRVLARFG